MIKLFDIVKGKDGKLYKVIQLNDNESIHVMNVNNYNVEFNKEMKDYKEVKNDKTK